MRHVVRRLIAASLLLLTFGSTAFSYATWGSSSSATGTVGAGLLDIAVIGSDAVPHDNIFTFIWNGTCTAGNLAPGDTCHVNGVGVTNVGTLTYSYSFAEHITPGSLNECFDISVAGIVDNNGGTTLRMPPGDQETFSMTLTVPLGAPNSCQGQTANVGLTLTAVLTTDPHGTVD